ncbi:MAG: ammonia-dependent NAD(+) synthetase [Nocardioidaceae bacterium]
MDRRAEIAAALGVHTTIDVEAEIGRRVGFLDAAMSEAPAAGLVLGISGGVDSATAGHLCQLAAQRRRDRGDSAQFLALRLPYGTQSDEADAETVIAAIGPDRVFTVDIRPATDATMRALASAGHAFHDLAHEDFVAGNVRARQRMVTQYAVANGLGGLVVGTDHAAEAVMGFFTKYGDGAADVVPLTGLLKRQVRALAARLGVPAAVVSKPPTADLEALRPMRLDEDAFGVSYDAIDDYLAGATTPDAVREIIENTYDRTAHKRQLPTPPPG